MNRRFVFIAGALALMVGLYFYDRDNSTRTVIATTVLAFEDQDNEAGPDTWHVTVDVLGEPTALEPLQTRPDIAIGDTLCVTRITRAGQPDEFRRANASDSC